jgi:hypothetical protein
VLARACGPGEATQLVLRTAGSTAPMGHVALCLWNHMLPAVGLHANCPPRPAAPRLQVKESMRVRPHVQYVSCSKVVGRVMGADVMRSVKHLLPDILDHMHVLLYQV